MAAVAVTRPPTLDGSLPMKTENIDEELIPVECLGVGGHISNHKVTEIGYRRLKENIFADTTNGVEVERYWINVKIPNVRALSEETYYTDGGRKLGKPLCIVQITPTKRCPPERFDEIMKWFWKPPLNKPPHLTTLDIDARMPTNEKRELAEEIIQRRSL